MPRHFLAVRADELHRRLNDDSYLSTNDGSTHGPGVVAAAQRFVEEIETAPAIALTEWERLSTAELSTTLALLSHLNPRALVKPYTLDDPRLTGIPAPVEHTSGTPAAAASETKPGAQKNPHTDQDEHTAGEVPADGESDPDATVMRERHQAAPGWVCCINGEHEPWFHDAHVQTLLYRNLRPFHPERLLATFNGPIGSGRLGTVIRSAGFCQLATRLPRIGLWSHVGQMITLDPTPFLSTDPRHPSGQELVLTGLGLDGRGIVAALDAATLDDEEFTAGPAHWNTLADPLTPWRG